MREHVLTIPPEERKNTILLFMDSRDVLIQTVSSLFLVVPVLVNLLRITS